MLHLNHCGSSRSLLRGLRWVAAASGALLPLVWVWGCSSGASPSHESGSGGTGGESASNGAGGGGSGLGGGEAGAAGDSGMGGEAGAPITGLTGDVLLDDLLVAGVRVPLKPEFSPGTLRYSVLAMDPAQDLQVTATAASHLDILIAGIETESGVARALPNIEPGGEFEVVVSDLSGRTRAYTIVYLPSHFPNLSVTTRSSGASEHPIYLTTRDGANYFAVKLNNDGVPLFYRETAQASFDFKKHATGEYSFAELIADPARRAQQVVLDADYRESRRIASVGLVNTDEHEFIIQPDGSYIVLSYEPVRRDMTEYGGSTDQVVVDSIVQELSPQRDLLFQWNSWDHMSFEESVYIERNGRDYSHINSVYVESDGDWLLSSRGMAQVLKVDRDSGDVLWRLGGMDSDFAFVNDPFNGLCGQHTASRLANGNILLFDNGQYCWPEVPERGELTRIVEYRLDETAMTAELVWSYDREGAYTISQGSVQGLDNGNVFIGWGIGTSLLATEVDREGNVVFELEADSPHGPVASYRAWRFAE